MRNNSGTPIEDTRAWVSDVVRSALWAPDDVRRQVVEAVAVDHPDLPAGETADAWIAQADEAWRAAASGWEAVTDHDRLLEAFAGLQLLDVVVLQGCADHWAVRDALRTTDPTPRGIAWFTPTDVWHAIDEGMLEVNLWHGTTANAAPGDALLDDVLATFRGAGLEAKFDEGRIEVAAYWQRRPPA